MKSSRLLALLLLLQSAGRRTAAELAAELEVSERTILRDVDALSLSGIPVSTQRGACGGIILAKGYRRALAHLGADDVRSLLVAGADPLADLGVGGRRSRVVTQLLGALTSSDRSSVLRTSGRVFVDQQRWYGGPQPFDELRALREAVFADLCVAFDYRDRAGARSRRAVEPLGLVFKTGVWYLVARCGMEMRTFRADRMSAVTVQRAGFARPADFDLETYWLDAARRMEAPMRASMPRAAWRRRCASTGSRCAFAPTLKRRLAACATRSSIRLRGSSAWI